MTLCGLLIGPLLVKITNRVLAAYEASSAEEASRAYPIMANIKWTHSRGLWSVVSGVLFFLSAWIIGMTEQLAISVFIISIMIILVQCDLRMMLLPNKVIFCGWIGVFVMRLIYSPSSLIWHTASSFIIGAVMLCMAILGSKLLKQEALGGGDIKLLTLVGLVLGLELSLLAIVIASLAGLLFALYIRYFIGDKERQYIPFGPFIAMGCIICLFWGERWLTWYYDLL